MNRKLEECEKRKQVYKLKWTNRFCTDRNCETKENKRRKRRGIRRAEKINKTLFCWLPRKRRECFLDKSDLPIEMKKKKENANIRNKYPPSASETNNVRKGFGDIFQKIVKEIFKRRNRRN